MSFLLNVAKRSKSSKFYLKSNKNAGMIPGVCYGGMDNVNLLFELKDFENTFKKVLYHRVLEINDGDDIKRNVLVKAYQIHPVTKKVIHVDFMEVSDDKFIIVKVPVILSGVSGGIKLGGVLEHKLTSLLIKSLPKDIPNSIDVNIEKLDVGDSIYVRDISLDKNLSIRNQDDQVIVAVSSSRVTRMAEETSQDNANSESSGK